ncbi:MAG TPA: ABC-F family ATP-binding cassette domain-containing protein [Polyangiaceae bacterium]|nr:ABC-F family ATP-binding cassette domain-containing protein [Polyangiaceae bacterium]
MSEQTAAAPVVSARGVEKTYGARTLFRDVSLTVREGEHVGLLGVNGTGKSTLLRVLAGLEPTDVGVVETRRGATVLYLSQEPILDDAATPRQIVESGLSEWHDATTRYAAIAQRLETATDGTRGGLLAEQAELAELIEHRGGWDRGRTALEMLANVGVRDVDRAVGTMSGGERRRVALAKLLVAEPDLAVLDEPTNHLDTETIEWLEEFLAEKFRGAVVVVTHDRYFLDAVADRIFELDRGRLSEYQGGYSDFLAKKAELLAHEARTEQNRLNLLRRERAWLLRGAKARTTKQKARVQRARALLETEAPELIQAVSLEGLDRGVKRQGKTIVDLEDVRIDAGSRTLVSSLSLRMIPGERIGVIGPNGAGKTSLLSLVAGEREPTSGRVVRGLNTQIVYFDQSRSGLEEDWTVFDNVAGEAGAMDRGGTQMVQVGDSTITMRAFLEQFLFSGEAQRQKVSSLSGGERARVALAKSLRHGANLLLLDEPTNDLDVSTLTALEDLLTRFPGAAIIVSHDRYFLDRVATSLLVFEGDGVVTKYAGGYQTYRSLKAQAAAAPAEARESAASPPPARADTPAAQPAKKPLSYLEKKELDGILDEISALEDALARAEDKLADPALYAGGPAPAAKARDERDALARAVADKTARWEDLESRRDAKSAR